MASGACHAGEIQGLATDRASKMSLLRLNEHKHDEAQGLVAPVTLLANGRIPVIIVASRHSSDLPYSTLTIAPSRLFSSDAWTSQDGSCTPMPQSCAVPRTLWSLPLA